ncbi:MAG TPA: flagellar basal body-associated FliL family protein [Candidatus Aquabacterium excrementipullorum]|nr:flagellar basal body-associated FliL family protein [Candidatus Aquabacterium excrementipullorum]
MAAAPAPAADAAPKGGGSKKLIIIIVAVLALVVVGGGAAAVLLMKKKADTAEASADGEEEHEAPAEHAKPKEHKSDGHPPTFVPLDPFTVNLADKDADRYAQVGINLQVEDPHLAEEIKNYMPAIRNGILLILSHKSSEDLLSPEGKQKLAEEIRRETARSMGYEVPDPDEDEDNADEDSPKKKKKKKKKAEPYNPIVHVHYSNFIVQ